MRRDLPLQNLLREGKSWRGSVQGLTLSCAPSIKKQDAKASCFFMAKIRLAGNSCGKEKKGV